MASAGEYIPQYRHTPLANPGNQIRLISFASTSTVDERDENTARIICNISVHELETAPTFRGISYTWGNEESPKEITIDGKPRTVRNNCFYALYQCNLQWPADFFWIDSICIDQNDNREKSQQVAMMGKIYARAIRVCACIGPHDESSTALVHLLELLESVISLHGYASILPGESYRNRDARSWQFYKKFRATKSIWYWTCLYHQLSNNKQRGVLQKFGQRAYWKRLWILQELHAVGRRRVDVLCGPRLFDFDRLLLLNRLVEGMYWDWDSPIYALGVMPHAATTSLEAVGDIVSYGPTKLDFPQDLSMVGHHECLDPRDGLYGTLSIFNYPAGQSHIIPDYDLSRFDLALDLLSRLPDATCHIWDLEAVQAMLRVDTRRQSFETWRDAQTNLQLSSPCLTATSWCMTRLRTLPQQVYRNSAGQLCTDVWMLPSMGLYTDHTNSLPGVWTQIRTGPRSFVLVDSLVIPGDFLMKTQHYGVNVALRRLSGSDAYVVGRIRGIFGQKGTQSEESYCACYSHITVRIPIANLDALGTNTALYHPGRFFDHHRRSLGFPKDGTVVRDVSKGDGMPFPVTHHLDRPTRGQRFLREGRSIFELIRRS